MPPILEAALTGTLFMAMPSSPRLMIIDSDCPQKWWALRN